MLLGPRVREDDKKKAILKLKEPTSFIPAACHCVVENEA